MRKIIFIAGIALLIVSCSRKDKLPKGILPKQQMEDVLWDLVKANEYLNGYVFNKDTSLDRTAETIKWYDNVYRIHHITKAVFEKSYAYYREHSFLIKEVLDTLIRRQPPIKTNTDSTIRPDSQQKKKILLPHTLSKFSNPDSIRKKLEMLPVPKKIKPAQ